LSTHEPEAGRFVYKYPHPAVASDLAIFGLRGGRLMILLIRRGGEPFLGSWALPGGFLNPTEDLDACARRELQEETGLEVAYLKQFGIFSAPDRDPRERVISVAYLALVPADRVNPEAGSDAADVAWRFVDDLPPLAFDHAEIIREATAALRREAEGLEILLNLMPRRFTLSRLQSAYEAICGASADKRNFRARILASGLVEATEEMERGSHRPAQLYERRPKVLNGE